MQHYGPAFRIARTAKGLTQKEVAEGILSVPALSKFESGKSMVAVNKFHQLLDRLLMSFQEFQVCFMDNSVRTQARFLSLLSQGIQSNNLFQLKEIFSSELKLFESTQNIRHYHNTLLTTGFINRLEDIPIRSEVPRQLYDYLFDTHEWGSYEVTLFGNSLVFFSLKQTRSLSDDVMSRASQLYSLPRYKVDLITVMLNVCQLYIQEQAYDLAYIQLKEVETLVASVPYLNEKNRFRYMKGTLLMHMGRYDEGLQLAQEAIDMYGHFGLFNEVQVLGTELQSYIDVLADK